MNRAARRQLCDDHEASMLMAMISERSDVPMKQLMACWAMTPGRDRAEVKDNMRQFIKELQEYENA